MAIFSPRDRAVIEAQKLDPHARITTNSSIALWGLIWSDEVSKPHFRLSSEGWNVWKALLTARNLIHAGYPVGAIPDGKDLGNLREL